MGFAGRPKVAPQHCAVPLTRAAKDEDLLATALRALAASGKAKVSLVGQPSDVVETKRREVQLLEEQARRVRTRLLPPAPQHPQARRRRRSAFCEKGSVSLGGGRASSSNPSQALERMRLAREAEELRARQQREQGRFA